jgi:hypothetical protein
MTTDRLTKMPEGCSMCKDGGHAQHLLHLHARCHMRAPLRLAYRRTHVDRGILFVTCYIPDCAQHVATFAVCEVTPAESKEPIVCDLCGDNDPRDFRATAVGGLHDFTAPFRIELHTSDNGERRLHIFCYVEECNRQFAAITLNDEAARRDRT